jgi:hypothetical protein
MDEGFGLLVRCHKAQELAVRALREYKVQELAATAHAQTTTGTLASTCHWFVAQTMQQLVASTSASTG